jgi:carbonic anhydrase/acetyltransferase-like protein (isoleucine patch superfamily)
MGTPARVKRPLTDQEVTDLAQFWQNYVNYTREYLKEQSQGQQR